MNAEEQNKLLEAERFLNYLYQDLLSKRKLDGDHKQLFHGLMNIITGLIKSAKVSGGESECNECGGHNPIWSAENDLWNDVVGSPYGILCPVCFDLKAREKLFTPFYRATKDHQPLPTAGQNAVQLGIKRPSDIVKEIDDLDTGGSESNFR
jgi:hypothetical protein